MKDDELKRKSATYFDGVAKRGEIIKEPAKCYPFVMEKIGKDVHSVIDIGCGMGVMLKMINEKMGNEVKIYGIDISEESLKKSKVELQGSATICYGDVEDIPFSDDSFDVAICMHSFHHYPNPQLALQEMYRVLKTPGRLYLVDNDVPFFKRIKQNFFYWYNNYPNGDIRQYSKNSVKRMAMIAGFSIVSCEKITSGSFLCDAIKK